MSMLNNSDVVRSILEEYTANIIDGATTTGDFYIATHEQKYLLDITSRLKKVGWLCSDTNNNKDGKTCISRFQPYIK